MKKNAIHENLSTSFVDLAALVKYLSRLQFAGSVRLELSSYEAEIRFSGGQTVEAREIDHSSGRIAKGDHALERILVRAQEPCGRINVYRDGSQLGGKVYVDETIVLRARRSASETADSRPGTFLGGSPTRTILPHVKIGGVDAAKAEEFRCDLEEIFLSLDASMSRSGLNFTNAFNTAAMMMSGRFSILEPKAGHITFADGRLHLSPGIKSKDVIVGVNAALNRIFERLREAKHLENVPRFAIEKLRLVALQKNDAHKRGEMSRLVECLVRRD